MSIHISIKAGSGVKTGAGETGKDVDREDERGGGGEGGGGGGGGGGGSGMTDDEEEEVGVA